MERQNVHARCVARTLYALHNARIDEGVERFAQSPHIVAHKRRKLFATQQRAWMPIKKHQQIHIAGVANDRHARQQPLGVFQLLRVFK